MLSCCGVLVMLVVDVLVVVLLVLVFVLVVLVLLVLLVLLVVLVVFAIVVVAGSILAELEKNGSCSACFLQESAGASDVGRGDVYDEKLLS
jgi:hypothetical protein